MSIKVFHCERHTTLLKSDIFSMEYPLFALDAKTKRKPLNFEHNGIFVEVTSQSDSDKTGRATTKDKEILMFCLSQLMAKKVLESKHSRSVSFVPYDYLKSVRRGSSGIDYEQFRDALHRLKHTFVCTNHLFNGRRIHKPFPLIEEYEFTERFGFPVVTIKLGGWLTQQAIAKPKMILTMHTDYLSLSRPFERRVYEVFRKFCGKKPTFEINLKNVHNRICPNIPLREFARRIKKLPCPLLNFRFKLEGQIIQIYSDTAEGRSALAQSMLEQIQRSKTGVDNIVVLNRRYS